MGLDLDTNVQYVKGVGPYMAKVLSKINIFTLRDLMFYFPREWEDRRKIDSIALLNPGQPCLIKGKLKKVKQNRTRRGFSITKALVSDGTGEIYVSWFNQQFLKKALDKSIGKEILISGKAEINAYSNKFEISARDYELLDGDGEERQKIVPKYPLTSGLYQKRIRTITKNVVQNCSTVLSDPLPNALKEKLQLIPLKDAVFNIHFPRSMEEIDISRKRLAFDDLFFLQLMLALRRRKIRLDGKGIAFKVDQEIINDFENSLPFKFTNAQKKVMDEIKNDMSSSKPMSRLVQGDVGSGKTVLAAEAAAIAVKNGYQAAIMAPTEILAQQHYDKIGKLLKPLKIKVMLLTSGEKKADKDELKAKIAAGENIVVVGTHAIISENVIFSNLGLAVVDEQHRFGVNERTSLREKGINPDLLVMTATPIPRSLALTLYGDLDRSIIDEMPPGRTPVITKYVPEKSRKQMYEFMREKMKEGRQVFVVCPLIEESEKLDLSAAKKVSKELAEIFKEYKVRLLYGKMKSDEKEKIMKDFSLNKIDLLVSTTVIEVGIDIPNATIMVIEHVERFGLSQMHQLRGRIGRGANQSYCFLCGKPATFESKERVKVMVETTDGFKIAEADLKLRGPGEFMGTRQSGLPEFKMADIVRDEQIMRTARKAAFDLVLEDPKLEKEENRLMKKEVLRLFPDFLEKDTFN